MSFATVQVQETITYTETASGVRPAGEKAGLPFRYWVTGNTQATQFTNADARVATQFTNMTTNGRSYTITGRSVVKTRPYAPLTP